MKVPLKWLYEYVSASAPAVDLAHRLTMAGIETSLSGAQADGRWKNVFVGRIAAVRPHPNADRLRLVDVDLGREHTTVVCGAPNLTLGDKVPFARLGAELVDSHSGQTFRLKRAEIRGVASEGMICSEKELGISESHEGIMVLDAAAPLGAPLADHLSDTVLNLEVTPNRPDCLSIIGVAWEAAALTGETVCLPPPAYPESERSASDMVSVTIADPDLCGRYCATFIEGVTIGPSPAWLQNRLTACGMRPINNIVDITNYVMLEYGQPLHAFDYDRLKEGHIVVRRARPEEKMTTLDGVERQLGPEMLVIADAAVPVALAGVMGGADSEVAVGTSRVLLESANFSLVSIRRTSRRFALQSEASTRFEKGISPELTVPAVRRATQLITELAGGRAARGVVDVYPGRKERQPIRLSASEIKRVLGVEIDLQKVQRILAGLGFRCQPAGAAALDVLAPYWRMDVRLPADLVEEIARITGYDQIPVTMPSGTLPHHDVDPLPGFREKVRDILVGCGLQEVITYSLVSREKVGEAPALRVLHPMSSEQEFLRLSLRPALLSILASNQRHEEEGIRIFEIGKVFLPRPDDLPEEREMLAAALSGPHTASAWLGDHGEMGFFDAKGVIEVLFQRLGVLAAFQPGQDRDLHPGRTAVIDIAGRRAGVIGELHPSVAERLGLARRPIALIELEVAALLAGAAERRRFEPLPRFPSSTRDLALLADTAIPAGKIAQVIQGFPLVSRVTLFDVYTGGQVLAGKRSLAFRVVYQSATRTLTQAEVDETEKEVLARLARELGAVLRA